MMLSMMQAMTQQPFNTDSLDGAPEVFTLPEFKDSTLLFYDDSIMWSCQQGDCFLEVEMPKGVDFTKVDSCVGFVEYHSKPQIDDNDFVSVSFYGYTNYASIHSIEDNVFQYLQFDDKGDTTRIDTLIFNFNKIVKVDSLFTENPVNFKHKLKVFRYFEVVGN